MLKFENWMMNVTEDDMPNDDLRFIAHTAGVKTALIILILLPSSHLSVPKYGLRLAKERYILNNYDGTRFSINKLALECGLSQRYVYKIIEKRAKNNVSK